MLLQTESVPNVKFAAFKFESVVVIPTNPDDPIDREDPDLIAFMDGRTGIDEWTKEYQESLVVHFSGDCGEHSDARMVSAHPPLLLLHCMFLLLLHTCLCSVA